MTENVVQLASEPGFWIGHFKNVSLQVWGGDVTVGRIDRCGDCNRAVLRNHADRLVTVAVILQTANPRVGSAERERVNRLADEQRSFTLASVQIVDGTGFWASTVRAVLTGLNLMSKAQQRVFDADVPAARWLVDAKHVDVPAPTLVGALAEARRLYAGQGT
jgi:hypothetical protein